MNPKLFFTVLSVIALAPISTIGQNRDTNPNNQSLRGMNAITVVVGNVRTISLPVGAKPDTPTVEQVKTEAEFWLKKFGINVVSSTDNQKIPSLLLVLLAEKDNNGVNHYDLGVHLMQEVTLQRDPSIKLRASTWDYGILGSVSGPKPFETDLICRAIVPFVTAYNSVNAPDKVIMPGDESIMCMHR